MSSFYNTLSPKNQFNWNLNLKNNLDLTKGYFIHGSQGCGKTVLAIQFCKDFLSKAKLDLDEMVTREDGTSAYRYDRETAHVRFISFLDIIKIARNCFGEDLYNAKREMDDLKNYELLVIDDLGTEKQTDFVQEVIYELIDHRYNYLRKTLITSNYSLKEISSKYHARIASRIAEMCEIISPKDQSDKRLNNLK